MLASAQPLQHLPRVPDILRFPEYLAAADRDGITSEDAA
jgi:hypothetical protein